MGLPILRRNDQRGTAIALNNPRGCDADDTAMPALPLDHGAVGGTQAGISVHSLDDGSEDLTLGFLALVVELVEASSNFAGLRRIFGGKEIDHAAGHIHTSGGVDARADTEANVPSREWPFAVELCHLEKSFESGVDRLAQTSEAEFGEDAVLSGKWDYVGNGADGGDLEERRQKTAAAGFFQKSLSKLEGNTRAAEILAWIRTPGLIWIENSVGAGGALWAWQMVVGNDKVET